jgi:hypothetical protein
MSRLKIFERLAALTAPTCSQSSAVASDEGVDVEKPATEPVATVAVATTATPDGDTPEGVATTATDPVDTSTSHTRVSGYCATTATPGTLVAEIAEPEPVPSSVPRTRAETARRRELIEAARDAAGLEGFRAALLNGRLHLCANCVRFTFDAKNPTGVGRCARFRCETWPFVPMLRCAGFQARTPDAAPAPAYLPIADAPLAWRGSP